MRYASSAIDATACVPDASTRQTSERVLLFRWRHVTVSPRAAHPTILPAGGSVMGVATSVRTSSTQRFVDGSTPVKSCASTTRSPLSVGIAYSDSPLLNMKPAIPATTRTPAALDQPVTVPSGA